MGLFDLFKKASAEPAKLYRAADLLHARMADGKESVYRRGTNGPAHVLPSSQAELLRRCTSPHSLEAHAAALAEALRLDGPSRRGLSEQLANLAARGLLIESPGMLVAPVEPEPRITRVVILTRERNELARRCLSEHLALFERFERDVELTVADDNPSPDGAARQKELFAGLPAKARLRYMGRAEKERAVERLARDSAVDPEIVRYAFWGTEGLPWTTGANHNAAQLDSAGERLLCLDDDVCGRATRTPGEPETGAALGPSQDPTQIWLYPSQDAALSAARFETIDPLALHEQAIGRSVIGALAKAAGASGLYSEGATPRLFTALESSAARIAVTSAGLAGDSGMGSPFYYLLLEGEARERLFADYGTLRTTRGMIRATTRLTVTDATHLMTPHVAFDLSRLPPPCHPVLRNSDGLFAVTLRVVDPDAYVAHLPWAAEHRPEPRSFGQGSLHGGPKVFYMVDLLALCLGGAPVLPGGRTSAERMDALGRHLLGLAGLPIAELEDWLRLRRMQQIGRLSQTIAERLDAAQNPPQAWVDDLEAVLEGLEATVADASFVLARDLPERDPGPRVLSQRLIGRFGALLCAWPTLYQAALRSSAQGVRVSVPVETR